MKLDTSLLLTVNNVTHRSNSEPFRNIADCSGAFEKLRAGTAGRQKRPNNEFADDSFSTPM